MIDLNRPLDPLNDGKSSLIVLDYWGSDKDVVEDARTSYGRVRSDAFVEKDESLLRFLIKHQHTSPFRGSGIKFHVKAPLFICRQWWKHVVSSAHTEEQLGWNEQSFRYTEPPMDFYFPSEFRAQSTTNKQVGEGRVKDQELAASFYRKAMECSIEAYYGLLEQGVCREQARAILAPAIYTQWVWTASLQTVLHFIGLRKGEGAQSEIVAYADAIEKLVELHFPVVMGIFRELGYQGF